MAAGLSQNKAYRQIGLAKSTAFYRHTPKPRTQNPTPHRDRVMKTALTDTERDTICRWLDHYDQLSVDEIFHLLLNQGIYIASLSSWWRIARTTGRLMKDKHPTTRRPQAGNPRRRAPQLTASQAGQVVCWDITFLPGYYRGHRYALHLVIDLYSRKILNTALSRAENATAAKDMIHQVILDHPDTLETVHSDNGKAMTSTQMQKLLDQHNVSMSLIRPGVSNDNPHMESTFHTLKYRPFYPRVFDTINHATSWVDDFVAYYNNHHPHSGIAGYTPQSVYDGTWRQAANRRAEALHNAYHAHPDRFLTPPVIKPLPEEVTLNLTNLDHATHTPRAGEALLTT